MLLIENELFKIYANEEYRDYLKKLIDSISYKARMMFDFYGLDSYPQVTIYIDKDINSKHLPDSIHLYYDVTSLKDELPINDIVREYSHILYNKAIEKSDKVAWLDEGLAQALGNTYSEINDGYAVFKEFFLSRIVARKYEIPHIEDLKEYGEGIGKLNSRRYDGKAFSYMLVRYLFTKGYDINKIIRDKDEVKRIETTIISDMLNYYGSYFNIRAANININYVKTPSDLMDFMNYGIEYSLNNRVNSIDNIIKIGKASDLEQAKLEKYIFDKLGLNSRIFCSRTYEDGIRYGKVDMHCMVIYEQDNKWYLFEHANPNKRGIKEFDSYDMALEDILVGLDNNTILTEIYEIPEGITINEFNGYVDQFVPLIKEDGLIKLDNKYAKII